MHIFEVTELSPNDFSQWDALVDLSPQGTIFHKNGWLKACERNNGKKLKIFGCFENGQLVGGCSFFFARKYGLLIADANCPMTPYGGFVLLPSHARKVHSMEHSSRKIIGALINRFNDEQFFYINFRLAPEFLDIRPFTWNEWRSEVNYTNYFFLDGIIESHFDSTLRKNIRKAENRIVIEDSSDIATYYALFCDTFNRKKIPPPISAGLLSALFSYIMENDYGEMRVARTAEGEIACARITVWDTRMAYNWTASSDATFFRLEAPSLLHFDNLKRMQNKGFSTVNMMMGNIPQLSRFVSSFNPTLIPYYQIQKMLLDTIMMPLKLDKLQRSSPIFD